MPTKKCIAVHLFHSNVMAACTNSPSLTRLQKYLTFDVIIFVIIKSTNFATVFFFFLLFILSHFYAAEIFYLYIIFFSFGQNAGMRKSFINFYVQLMLMMMMRVAAAATATRILTAATVRLTVWNIK